MLKARPNQMMPSKSINTNGRTIAASAISDPSALRSWRAICFKLGKQQILRFPTPSGKCGRLGTPVAQDDNQSSEITNHQRPIANHKSQITNGK
jgi:hypothetical protein